MGFNKWQKCCSNRNDLKDYFQKNIGTNFIFKSFIMDENIAKQEIVLELVVKFVLLVILIEKNHLLQKNHNESSWNRKRNN